MAEERGLVLRAVLLQATSSSCALTRVIQTLGLTHLHSGVKSRQGKAAIATPEKYLTVLLSCLAGKQLLQLESPVLVILTATLHSPCSSSIHPHQLAAHG